MKLHSTVNILESSENWNCIVYPLCILAGIRLSSYNIFYLFAMSRCHVMSKICNTYLVNDNMIESVLKLHKKAVMWKLNV